MIFVYYLAAALLVFLSYKSLRGGIDYLNYFKRELAKPPSQFTPFATVIAPCKGLDEGLEENLKALLDQDYPAYEVIFVVDDENDPAVAVIEAVSHENSKLVIADKAIYSSQKVENLREAVIHADPRSEVFVFVDSDARPSPNWLRSLTAPLAEESIGASTGYRWFISKTPSLASELRSSWNASIASALGANTASNFCWGGSMAIRRAIFDELNIREQWAGTLSDDFAVTRAMKAAGKKISFVPQALTPSIENCSIGELFEFTNRQMKITQVYAPKLWVLSFVGSGLFNLVMSASLIILFLFPMSTLTWAAAMITLVSVTVLSVAKAWLRLAAVKLVMPGHSAHLDRQMLSQLTLWAFTPAIFFFNSAAALASRSIKWRGTRYEMVSPRETRLIGRR